MTTPTTTTPTVTTRPTLADLTRRAHKHIDAILGIEAAAIAATLPERIGIGLACLAAHAQFAATLPAKRGQGRKGTNKTQSTSIEGFDSFESWRFDALFRIPRPTCYKYMEAASGLGLTAESDPDGIPEALAAWEKATGFAPNLKALVAASTLRTEDEQALPSREDVGLSIQSDFEFYKTTASACRRATEDVLSIRDQLPEDFKRALTANFYAALHDLTGTHWAPSAEAPEIANVNPGAITL